MHRLLVATLSCVFACVTSFVSADDWLEFRGPGGQGHAGNNGVPTKWSTEENVAWKSEIPGKGWSSPVLFRGKLYLTTAVPDGDGDIPGQSLRGVCVDATSGKIEWNVELFRMVSGNRVHPKNSHASASPLCDGERIYMHFGTHGTACLEQDGSIVWTTKELKYAPVHGNGGSPVLFEDLIIVNCDGADRQSIVALDRKDGSIRWQRDRAATPVKGFAFCTPILIKVANETQLVSSGADVVMGLSPLTGEEIWRVQYKGGYSVVPRPVYANGMVFVCTGYDSPTLLAIRVDGAKGDVTESHVAWKVNKRVPLNPSPLVIDGLLYLISDDGVLSCLESDSGNSIWQQRVGGAYSASPTYVDGRIYLQSEQGETTVVAPGREYKELAKSELGERTFASYAIAKGAIFLRSENALWRLQEK